MSWRWARLVSVVLLCGCSRLRPHLADNYVYVTAKETFLRDRIAAVSNRTGTVHNGDRLKVLERGRRFVRVQTEKGETGWIDEKVVAPQEIFSGFGELGKAHKGDQPVASGVVRDEVYLHLKALRWQRQSWSRRSRLARRRLRRPVRVHLPFVRTQRTVRPLWRQRWRSHLLRSRWRIGGWCGTPRDIRDGC